MENALKWDLGNAERELATQRARIAVLETALQNISEWSCCCTDVTCMPCVASLALKGAPPATAVSLLFVVNGEDVRVEAVPSVRLSAARDRALVLSHNTGRLGPDWEVRRDNGALLDPEQTLAAQGLDKSAALQRPIFVTLRCGVGGSDNQPSQ